MKGPRARAVSRRTHDRTFGLMHDDRGRKCWIDARQIVTPGNYLRLAGSEMGSAIDQLDRDSFPIWIVKLQVHVGLPYAIP